MIPSLTMSGSLLVLLNRREDFGTGEDPREWTEHPVPAMIDPKYEAWLNGIYWANQVCMQGHAREGFQCEERSGSDFAVGAQENRMRMVIGITMRISQGAAFTCSTVVGWHVPELADCMAAKRGR